MRHVVGKGKRYGQVADTGLVLALMTVLLFYASPLGASVCGGLLQHPSVSPNTASDTHVPSFAVASIKPDDAARDNSGNSTRLFQFPGPGRIHTVNIPVRFLIQFAYDVSYSQVAGGPPWAGSQGYVIDAEIDDSDVPEFQKLPSVEQRQQVRLMVRALLADRFKLVLSPGTKQMQVYALVLAKGGPKLTPTSDKSADPNGPPNSESQRNRGGAKILPGEITGVNQSMSGLAETLSLLPELGGHIVQDHTDIKGNYDFDVKYTPENPSPNAAPINDATTSPSIFTALEEDLGLRLESTKGPVRVYTIEHVEQPSQN